MTGAWLIGCEYSGTVSEAFRKRGIPAYSCDLLPTEGDPAWHIQGDVLEAIRSRLWAGIILHIPRTAMGVCGNKHYGTGKPKHRERIDAIRWSCRVVEWACGHGEMVAVENPASVIFPILRDHYKFDVQYIQPWQHGHPEQKKTGLALWNLPRLTPTNDVYEEMMKLPRKERERIFYMSPSADRGKERARFYPGIASAMADQWGVAIHGSEAAEPQLSTQRRAA